MCIAEYPDIYIVIYGFMLKYAYMLVSPEVMEYFVYEYSWVMKSYISMLRCARMLVFPEVVECLYKSIVDIYMMVHVASCLGVLKYLYFTKV
jgi:hypothetical protein